VKTYNIKIHLQIDLFVVHRAKTETAKWLYIYFFHFHDNHMRVATMPATVAVHNPMRLASDVFVGALSDDASDGTEDGVSEGAPEGAVVGKRFPGR
jgi:hypothetical protein